MVDNIHSSILYNLDKNVRYLWSSLGTSIVGVSKAFSTLNKPLFHILPLSFIFNLLRVVFSNFIHLIYLLICTLFIVVLVCFCKSLQPRYYFFEKKEDTNDPAEQNPNLVIENGSTKLLNRRFPVLNKFLHEFSEKKTNNEKKSCLLALSNSNIKAVYQQLPWYFTNADLELVNWLNQILETFWPSIKTLLNKYVFDDLLKPKKTNNKLVPRVSRELTKKQTKLSIYFSSLRKLKQLRQEATKKKVKPFLNNKFREFFNRSSFIIIFYSIKLVVIYLKQFFIDFIMYLINHKKQITEESTSDQKKKKKKTEVNLDSASLISSFSNNFRNNDNDKYKAPRAAKSWAGFDLISGRREQFCTVKRKREMSKSAPPGVVHISPGRRERIICKSFGLSSSTKNWDKFRQNRLRLAQKIFINTNNNNKNNSDKEITIEKIQLGDSIPRLNGIKYIEDLDSHQHVLTAPSDDNNMKFMMELSYESDRKFLIRLNSIPVLNRFELNKIGFRIRLLIVVNHTTTELNKDLNIMDTPGDILFPTINYVQLRIVDMPILNWKLNRPPQAIKQSSKNKDHKGKTTIKLILSKISKYLDPIYVINHTYFKYLVHSVIYFTLKWFQPFDIKLGSHMYIRTMC